MFFFSSRRRHTRSKRDWSSDVCSSDLADLPGGFFEPMPVLRQALLDVVDEDARLDVVEAVDVTVVSVEDGSQSRSEERRVGKECRSGGSWEREKESGEEAGGESGSAWH